MIESLARIRSSLLRQRTSSCQSCLYRLHRPSPSHHSNQTVTLAIVQTHRYHSSPLQRQNTSADTNTQAHPLGDFYADLLAQPIPRESNATTDLDLPTFVASGGDATKEERAAKLFGNIKGSGYERRAPQPDQTWQTINGVPVPPRPTEPDNCCMSGCVHCVWDDYRDDVEQWAMRLKEAQAKETKTPKVQMPRTELRAASTSMDDDGGGSEALWQSPSPGETNIDGNDDLFAGIPIGIREFMNVEKKIRERKRERLAAQEEVP